MPCMMMFLFLCVAFLFIKVLKLIQCRKFGSLQKLFMMLQYCQPVKFYRCFHVLPLCIVSQMYLQTRQMWEYLVLDDILPFRSYFINKIYFFSTFPVTNHPSTKWYYATTHKFWSNVLYNLSFASLVSLCFPQKFGNKNVAMHT